MSTDTATKETETTAQDDDIFAGIEVGEDTPTVQEATQPLPGEPTLEELEARIHGDEEDEHQTQTEQKSKPAQAEETEGQQDKQTAPDDSWKLVAAAQGIPQQLIDFCRDEEQLRQALELRRQDAGAQEQEEAASEDEAPPLSWDIPEDEFDQTDPLHQQVKKMVETLNSEILDRRKGELIALRRVNELLRHREESRASKIDDDFDTALDELEANGVLGNKGSSKRQEVHDLFWNMLQQNPQADVKKLAQRSAYATFPALLQEKARNAQQQNLDKQRKRVTGGGPSPRYVDSNRDPMDNFNDWLDGLLKE